MTAIPLGISVDNSVGIDRSYHSPILWITRYVDVVKPGKQLSRYWPNGVGCRCHNAGAFRQVVLIAQVVLSAPLSARSPTSSVSSRNPRESTPLVVVARSTGSSFPRILCCSARTPSQTQRCCWIQPFPPEFHTKRSAWRRRSFRKAFDLGIHSNCSFPRETHAQMLYSASVLVPQIVGFARTASRARFATSPKSTRKRSVVRRRSFRKAFVPQISPFRKKSVTCSASFLMSRICSNSLFLTLARHRRSNCRFLEEIRVKRAPLGVVARSAGSSIPRICYIRKKMKS